MCEHCGVDHPEFEDIANDLQFLDRAKNKVADLEESRGDNGYSISINPYAADQFIRRYVDQTCEEWMDAKVYGEKMDSLQAIERYAVGVGCMMFSMAMLTHEWWEQQDAIWQENEVSRPSQEETEVWVAEQRAELARREAALENITPEKIREALQAAGIDVPANVQVVDMGQIEALRNKTGEEDSGGDTGMYL